MPRTRIALIGDTRLDSCFTDLIPGDDGRARITLAHPDGARRVTLALDPAFHVGYVARGRYLLQKGEAKPDPDQRGL